MTTLVLGGIGTALGSGFGGSILGLSGAKIGGMIGSTLGSAIDAELGAGGAQRAEGPRMEDIRVTSSTEGAVIPRVFGRMRAGGNIIWATDFREEKETRREGGKGGGPRVTTTEYRYFASFAVAICEGPIGGVARIWADGKPLDAEGVSWRLYPGSEDQAPDPHITDLEGAGNVPAYRGTAYAVFEDMEVTAFGGRIPQLSFEVIRPSADPDSAEQLVRAVTLIPAAGEFVYSTEEIDQTGAPLEGAFGTSLASGTATAQNRGSVQGAPDIVAALDQLQAAAPNLEAVSLVVSWFGTDLRAGDCAIRPGVEFADKVTTPKDWSVSGVSRAEAHLVSRNAEGAPNYGGTPADFAVVQAIQEIRSRGLRVTFYPFLLMDISAGNTLPDPYSDNAAATGQPALPWRGRITCTPAPGYDGTVDQTVEAGDQVAAFFGSAEPGDFTVTGESVAWAGGTDRGLRRMILHYAHLCAAAGGVDAFLIGSELRGLTTIRDSATTYPAVQAFRDLAGDVRAILGAGTAISYAADWSEYFGHHPGDGSDDVFFHLDPLWADGNIDFVGIDNYMPISDWRDGDAHADAAAGWSEIRDVDYLQANIEGGEGYDWFYANPADRAAQARTPITDGAGRPWVFRYKDIRAWWSNAHYDRPGGVEAATPTAWVPESKPIRFTEAGCPAIDRGTNQPNVFFDPKSSESSLPHFSRGWRDDLIQRRAIEAIQRYWAEPANNPASSHYAGRMIDTAAIAWWTWDARPFPAFPGRTDLWSDGANWQRGHWLTGRLGGTGLAELVRELCAASGLAAELVDAALLAGAVPGFAVTAIESPRAAIGQLARFHGFDAVESGGRIRFVPRHRRAVAEIAADELVAAERAGEDIELTRGQETELPRALKWRLLNADADYAGLTVEARRITVDTARIEAERFALATHQGRADRAVQRALREAWVAREGAGFALPPSRLALAPADVVTLAHDGRDLELVIDRLTDGAARRVEARRGDRVLHDIAPGPDRAITAARLRRPAPPRALLMNLPQLSEAVPAWQPYAAAYADPWYGEAAIWRSPGQDDWRMLRALARPAGIGRLVAPLPAGPAARRDRANTIELEIAGGTLESVGDLALLGGANALAVQTGADAWEVLQFRDVQLLAPGRYRLSMLLRGQRGTESAIGDPAPVDAFCVVLNDALRGVPVTEDEIDAAWTWRIGPATAPVGDTAHSELSFIPTGRGLRPFAPAHPRRTDMADGSIRLAWTRRSRALAADSWSRMEVPLAEEAELYDLEITDGGSVVRTVAGLGAPAFDYTASMIAEDFAAGPASLGVRVWQIGALGRGDVLEATLANTRRIP